jgi:predicted nucleic acid-binding protein
VIVVDASAAVSALLHAGTARAALTDGPLSAPHLIDVEVASALRRRVVGGALPESAGWTALDTWRRIGITRYAADTLLGRVWELRDNLGAYDATYVALAEALDCALLTADGRLSRTPALRCAVTVVPN